MPKPTELRYEKEIWRTIIRDALAVYADKLESAGKTDEKLGLSQDEHADRIYEIRGGDNYTGILGRLNSQKDLFEGDGKTATRPKKDGATKSADDDAPDGKAAAKAGGKGKGNRKARAAADAVNAADKKTDDDTTTLVEVWCPECGGSSAKEGSTLNCGECKNAGKVMVTPAEATNKHLDIVGTGPQRDQGGAIPMADGSEPLVGSGVGGAGAGERWDVGPGAFRRLPSGETGETSPREGAVSVE